MATPPATPSHLDADAEPTVRTIDGSEAPDTHVGWARLWAVSHPRTRPMLRSGAWYPVVASEAPAEVVLRVRHRDVRVPPQYVEVRVERPARFTVVCRSRIERNPATGTTRDLGSRYAVCPASGHRIRLTGKPTNLECPGCGYRGEIAWGETG
jgi:hypothetical protein